MNKMSKKGIISIAAVVIILVAVIGIISVMMLRISSEEAESIAMAKTGGGEIVSEEISKEGPLYEYNYIIVNGNKWYDIEINGFGNITGIESGTGDYRRH